MTFNMNCLLRRQFELKPCGFGKSLVLKALSKLVADDILKFSKLFFRENKVAFHMNCLFS